MGLTRYPFFKVGLSYKPTNRWTYFPDYKSAQKMVVAYCTDNPDQMGRMEEVTIEKFRKWDRRGRVINPNGDPRCLNRAPGGENKDHGHSPFFCYIVFTYKNRR